MDKALFSDAFMDYADLPEEIDLTLDEDFLEEVRQWMANAGNSILCADYHRMRAHSIKSGFINNENTKTP